MTGVHAVNYFVNYPVRDPFEKLPNFSVYALIRKFVKVTPMSRDRKLFVLKIDMLSCLLLCSVVLLTACEVCDFLEWPISMNDV